MGKVIRGSQYGYRGRSWYGESYWWPQYGYRGRSRYGESCWRSQYGDGRSEDEDSRLCSSVDPRAIFVTDRRDLIDATLLIYVRELPSVVFGHARASQAVHRHHAACLLVSIPEPHCVPQCADGMRRRETYPERYGSPGCHDPGRNPEANRQAPDRVDWYRALPTRQPLQARRRTRAAPARAGTNEVVVANKPARARAETARDATRG